MKQSRSLSLKREALAELALADLQQINGAARALSDQYGNCTLDDSYRVCSLFCQMTFNTCG